MQKVPLVEGKFLSLSTDIDRYFSSSNECIYFRLNIIWSFFGDNIFFPNIDIYLHLTCCDRAGSIDFTIANSFGGGVFDGCAYMVKVRQKWLNDAYMKFIITVFATRANHECVYVLAHRQTDRQMDVM